MAIPGYWLNKNRLVYEAILEYNGHGNKTTIILNELIDYLKDISMNNTFDGKSYSRRELSDIIADLAHFGLVVMERKDGIECLSLKSDYYKAKMGLAADKKRRQPTDVSCDESIEDNKDNTESFEAVDIASISNLNYYVEKIKKYEGRDKNLVSYLPKLLSLCFNIMTDQRTDWESRMFISTALGYFLIEDNVIPCGKPYCYLDDLFLVSYVLELVKFKNQPLLVNHWNESENIEGLLDYLYTESKLSLGEKVFKILNYVGIAKYFRENKELKARRDRSNSSSLKRERDELLGMVAYLLNQVYGVATRKHSRDYLMEKLKMIGEEQEIMRMIAIAKGELVPASQKSDDELLKKDLELLEDAILLQGD